MTRIKTEIIWVVNCLLISGFVSPALVLDGFTQADHKRLVRGGNPDNYAQAIGSDVERG
jgi:hypothetical protein